MFTVKLIEGTDLYEITGPRNLVTPIWRVHNGEFFEYQDDKWLFSTTNGEEKEVWQIERITRSSFPSKYVSAGLANLA